MVSKNLKPIIVKSRGAAFSNTESLQNTIIHDVIPEPVVSRVSVKVPELGLVVKLRKGHNIKDWLIRYCKNNVVARPRIYRAYDITEEYSKEVLGGEASKSNSYR